MLLSLRQVLLTPPNTRDCNTDGTGVTLGLSKAKPRAGFDDPMWIPSCSGYFITLWFYDSVNCRSPKGREQVGPKQFMVWHKFITAKHFRHKFFTHKHLLLSSRFFGMAPTTGAPAGFAWPPCKGRSGKTADTPAALPAPGAHPRAPAFPVSP